MRGFDFGIACLLLASASTFAQVSTAQLSGRVTDQRGNVRQGATVSATQIDTGYTRNDLTDANGSYLLALTRNRAILDVRRAADAFWICPAAIVDHLLPSQPHHYDSG